MKNMNKIKAVSFSAIIALFVFSGCNDDFVNTKPQTEVLSEEVWRDPGLADAFVTEIYGGLGNGGFDEQMLASLTDEAIFTHPGRGINTITESRSNPADPGWINGTILWFNMYARIRACNLAIENLETPQFDDPALVTRLKGEAYFMRAYFYHQLVRYYGAVPLIRKSYELDEADYSLQRNSFEECVNFIVEDADAAAALLEGKTMVSGRASKAAALALKSRILLYAASDLHDVPTATDPNKSAVLNEFFNQDFAGDNITNAEILGYPGTSAITRTLRWQKAQDAALAVLMLPGFGHALNLAAPVTPQIGADNYMNVALAKNGGENELIFARYFLNSKPENGGRQGLFNGPNGYHNWAGNSPLQNLVDDYEMMDGTKFDWNNPAHAAAPYANRDPRFAASILYDGATWKPRPADVAAKDPANQIQTGQYEITDNTGTKRAYFGLDTRQSSVEDWNGTRTGYYVRKFIDPNPAVVDQNTWQQVPWPIFRYTEAVLNYVEASIALGQDAEARTWLNKIRFRAGMPEITESGDALMERYRNERRIEMAYEEHRYHDVRRWMIAPTTLGRKARRINITAILLPGKSVTIYKYDPASYLYKYEPLDIDPGIENRLWLDKMYYLPIQRDEINRNSKLAQNPGF